MDQKRPAQPLRPERGGDHLPPRHRRGIQKGVGTESQKSSGAARQDCRQLLRRTEHPDAGLLRTGRTAAQRRHREHGRRQQQSAQRRNPARHRAQHRGAPGGSGGHAPFDSRRAGLHRQTPPLRRGQRRRRRAQHLLRTAAPGRGGAVLPPPGGLTAIRPRRCSTSSPSGRNSERSRASRSQSSATFSTAGSPAATSGGC